MQATRVESLERTIQKTNEWLKAIQDELEWGERQQAYVALRATLHVLRDRLNPDEALQLGAQLPMMIRGIYYEGWKIAGRPLRLRTQEEFFDSVAREAGVPIEAEATVRAVFKVLAEHVSAGEIEDVKGGLPGPLRELWPS